MERIVRKQVRLKAKGKNGAFRVRGQPVEQAKIDRWQKRTNYSQAAFIAQQASTPTPTTPAMTDMSYSTISDRGSLSPYIQPKTLDTNRRNAQLTSKTLPCSFDSRSNDKIGFDDTESTFGGQSPAPFTAPPSPIVSWKGPSSIAVLPALSNEPIDGLVPSASSTPLESHFPRQNTATTEHDITMNTSKTRFRQHEETKHRQRLEFIIRRHGPDHPAALDTLTRLGVILMDQGRYRAAEAIFRKAIEGAQKTFGDSHSHTIKAHTFLSTVLSHQGRHEAALMLSRKLYTIASSTLHPTGEAFIGTQLSLARDLSLIAQYSESEALYQAALKTTASMQPLDSPSLLRCLSSMAMVMLDQGKLEESEKILQQVTLSRSLTLGAEHQDTLDSNFNLCRVMFRQGNFAEAVGKVKQLFEAHTKLFGPEHPRTLACQELLANTLTSQNRHGEAERLLRDALEKMSRVFGPRHGVTLAAEVSLTRVMLGQKRYLEVETFGKKSISLSENNPWLEKVHLESMIMVGRAQIAQGYIEDGRAMLEKALDACVSIFSKDHPLVKTLLRNIWL